MTPDKRTKLALDESRTLMLGAQILLGFEFQGPFQTAFSSLPLAAKLIYTMALCLMVVVVGLLIAPSAYHRIVERGAAGPRIDRIITRAAEITLAPFATAMALDLAIAAQVIGGMLAAVGAGILGFVLALGFWYGPMLFMTKKNNQGATMHDTSTETKIEFAMTESRIVLPGAQALLGIQLAIVVTQSFAAMSQLDKALHGVALASIAISTVLLMTPAAYHRIVYAGEAVPAFYDVASRLVLAATAFLAIGLAVEMYVVVGKITGSPFAGIVAGAISMMTLVGLWHVWPMFQRRRRGLQP
ncbi:DUF6328 family protein [Mesorhizobium sp. B2-1-3A]|uniref:DUF6328 family protein n=1 Tax=Mesorhizobium sp. B2-1-3A TaxID=2589971 RepID=UPI00112B9A4D|nr:DUF6328 family protein [Mesorhizobium sp. B2-1-3A]TPM95046.1 hypothetical protein FJ977_23690 [Mesorhizobium sp. B2-1-3A]